MPAYGYTRPIGNYATEPIAPVIEHYEGENNPYRGIETHGVPPITDDRTLDAPELDYIDEKEFDYPAERHKQDPVPVFIVNDSPIEEKRFITAQYSLSGIKPIRIAAQDRMRTRMRFTARLKNVFIGNTESVDVTTGALVDFNNTGYSELITTDDVWACTAAGETATLYVIFERWTDNRTIEDKVKK